MDGNAIGPRFYKTFDVVEGIVDHEVHVEEEIGGPVECGNHLGTQGKVTHEMAIHDVDVDRFGACSGDPSRLLGEMTEVCG